MTRYLGVIPLLVLLAVAIGSAPPATASSYTVTKTADTADGICDSDCSLREAIIAANANPGRDTITIPAGTYTLTIPGRGEDQSATGDLDITDDLDINGAGAASTIIDGGGIDRVLQVVGSTADNAPVVDVHITGVTIRNGYFDAGQDSGPGGGAVLTSSGLTLIDSVVEDSTANGGGGGGVLNLRYLTLDGSTIRNNVAVGGDGGGIATAGDVGIIRSTISGNMAESGGSGGGISNTYLLEYVTDSAIIGNTSSVNGGALLEAGPSLDVFTNVTLDSNSARRSGGVAFIQGLGTPSFVNSTITNNWADSDSNGDGDGGTVATDEFGWTYIQSTVLSGNGTGSAANDCPTGLREHLVSYSNNVIVATPNGCTMGGDTSTVRFGIDPRLGPLSDNGGPTLTRALLPGSPLIDAGGTSCTDHDQRGEPRPQDGNGDGILYCDIGAYEAPGIVASPTPILQNIHWGDNNCLDGVDPIDAMLPLRFFAGLAVEAPGCPALGMTVDVFQGSIHLWGDVDCDGQITPEDSLRVLLFVAGQSPAAREHCPAPGDPVVITSPTN